MFDGLNHALELGCDLAILTLSDVHPRFAVVDDLLEFRGRKPPVHRLCDESDSTTRKVGGAVLDAVHAQDADSIALLQAEAKQRIRKLANVAIEVGKVDSPIRG